MLLVDASALGALLDASEPDHAACVRVVQGVSGQLVTTWPVLTEAMHLLGAVAGWRGQDALWQMCERGVLVVMAPSEPQVARARALMQKYKDMPMDLGDASLVALAEHLGARRIFTLDGDFRVYRLHGRVAFDVVP